MACQPAYTASFGLVDEDGYQRVLIHYPGGEKNELHVLRRDIAGQWVEQELAILNSFDEQGDEVCQHGLSAALCSGNAHYPF